MRSTLDLRSPRSFYAGFDPGTRRSLVILEDLSVDRWTFPDPQHNKVTRADAEDMVNEMARYHGALCGSARCGTDLEALKDAERWQQDLDRRVGFRAGTLRGFDRATEVLPEALVARRDEVYPAFHHALALHRNTPSTLLHQDLHLGNWLRDPDGRMGLYDWQCVARGNWALDYVYAITGVLEPDDRREWEEDQLGTYLERLGDAGVASATDFDNAWLAYRQQPMHAFGFGLLRSVAAGWNRNCSPATTRSQRSRGSPASSTTTRRSTPCRIDDHERRCPRSGAGLTLSAAAVFSRSPSTRVSCGASSRWRNARPHGATRRRGRSSFSAAQR